MSLLKQDNTKKGQVDKITSRLEFDNSRNNDRKYEVEVIRDSEVYTRESNNHLPGLYYLVSWKIYREEKNTWKTALAVQQLQRLLNIYHNKLSKKPTITSPLIDSASPMTRLIANPAAKQKQGGPTKTINNKRGRKN